MENPAPRIVDHFEERDGDRRRSGIQRAKANDTGIARRDLPVAVDGAERRRSDAVQRIQHDLRLQQRGRECQ